MSARVFQNVINQLKETVNKTIYVLDDLGYVIACTELVHIGESRSDALTVFDDEHLLYVDGKNTYCPIGSYTRPENVIIVEGTDKDSADICNVLSVSFTSIKSLYGEKYDKISFIKNIILDNILPSDIYIKAKELHFDVDAPKAVFFIRFNEKGDVIPYDILQNMFPDKNKDYVISIGETDIVLVKEVKNNCDSKELEKIAHTIADTISAEFYFRVTVGIGTIAETLKDLSTSFRESQVAIEVGKVFDTKRNIINYENLGIGRLIYQLPTTLCEMFLQEVFKKGSLESLDRETLMTIQAFFENNLNVSETSRKLFVHRNTLVYRLEKIRKLTGLALREFEHAITFKVALMVKKYLTSKPVKY